MGWYSRSYFDWVRFSFPSCSTSSASCVSDRSFLSLSFLILASSCYGLLYTIYQVLFVNLFPFLRCLLRFLFSGCPSGYVVSQVAEVRGYRKEMTDRVTMFPHVAFETHVGFSIKHCVLFWSLKTCWFLVLARPTFFVQFLVYPPGIPTTFTLTLLEFWYQLISSISSGKAQWRRINPVLFISNLSKI